MQPTSAKRIPAEQVSQPAGVARFPSSSRRRRQGRDLHRSASPTILRVHLTRRLSVEPVHHNRAKRRGGANLLLLPYFAFTGTCLIIQVILSLMLIPSKGGIIIIAAIRGPA